MRGARPFDQIAGIVAETARHHMLRSEIEIDVGARGGAGLPVQPFRLVRTREGFARGGIANGGGGDRGTGFGGGRCLDPGDQRIGCGGNGARIARGRGDERGLGDRRGRRRGGGEQQRTEDCDGEAKNGDHARAGIRWSAPDLKRRRAAARAQAGPEWSGRAGGRADSRRDGIGCMVRAEQGIAR